MDFYNYYGLATGLVLAITSSMSFAQHTRTVYIYVPVARILHGSRYENGDEQTQQKKHVNTRSTLTV